MNSTELTVLFIAMIVFVTIFQGIKGEIEYRLFMRKYGDNPKAMKHFRGECKRKRLGYSCNGSNNFRECNE
jgi:hypothetical protein